MAKCLQNGSDQVAGDHENVKRGLRLAAHTRRAYFDALEVLRGHISRCLGQVAAIGGMDLPQDGLVKNYQGAWQLEAYDAPSIERE